MLKPLLLVLAVSSIVAAETLKSSTYPVLINGGAAVDANYSTHEEDLQAFRMTLFKGKGVVLNAGGEGTPILNLGPDGLVERDEHGLWKVSKSEYPGTQRPAKMAELKKVFDQFGRGDTPKLTLFFGDHGTPEGVSLWNETVNASQLHKLHQSLSPEALVRSIHIHCFSNAAVVDPTRTLPATTEAWPQYLESNYRKNSCAIAVSGEDEVGDYLDFGKNWKNGTWKKILDELPNPSLSTLRNRLVEEKKLIGTIKLTSDNLAEDVVRFFCKDQNFSSPGGPLSGSANAHSFEGKSVRSVSENNETCPSKKEEAELAEIEKKLKQLGEVSQDTTLVLGTMAGHFIQEVFPKLDKEAFEAHEVLDGLLRKDILDGKQEFENDPEYKKAMVALDKYNLIRTQVEHAELAPELFDENSKTESFKSWLQKEDVKVKFPAAVALMTSPEMKGKSIFDALNKVHEELDKTRGERKKYYRRIQGKRRKFLEALIKARASDPEIAKIKEYYESIKNCEKSALN